MRRSFARVSAVLMLSVLGVAPTVTAQDDEPSSSLKFMVVRDYNGKPVANAAVILHPVNPKGKQSRGGMELKTDHEGRTAFDGIPYGMLRVQVIAQGFQTFGEDYDVGKPTMAVTIKLKRPAGQYSTYESPKKDDKNPPETKPEEKPQ